MPQTLHGGSDVCGSPPMRKELLSPPGQEAVTASGWIMLTDLPTMQHFCLIWAGFIEKADMLHSWKI